MAEILDRHSISATFFCIADQLEASEAKSVFLDILARGHEVGNHTWSHPQMDTLTESERQQEIRKGHEAIERLLGATPKGFRAPNYFTTPESLQFLSEMGYSFDASAYRSRLTRMAYALFTAGFEKKTQSPYPKFHFEYPANRPSIMTFQGGNRMVEWPLQSALGLAYLGTLHCITPTALFVSQTCLAKATGRHIHYALHLIEATDDAVQRQWPWLPTLSRKYYLGKREPLDWLSKRLQTISRDRTPTTLTRLSKIILKQTSQPTQTPVKKTVD